MPTVCAQLVCHFRYCMPRAACSVSVIVLLLCLWGPSTALDVCEAPSMLRPRFVLFGDSLTQRSFENGGFGAGLTNAYQRKVWPQPLCLLSDMTYRELHPLWGPAATTLYLVKSLSAVTR